MPNPEKSLFVFGLYLVGLGASLILSPNTLLDIFEISNTSEIWIRVLGTIVLYLGIYYIWAAKDHWYGLIVVSVPLRMSIIVFFSAFVIVLDAPKVLLLLASVDFIFALWTLMAIKYDPREF